ncbi:MAG: ankyrin repeat domain-containing protein [Oligoflexales bacterium]
MNQSRQIHWRKENVNRLLAFGSNPKMQEKYGHSALMLAIRCNWPQETIELLLEKGADPDARTTKGIAPLHYLMHHKAEDYRAAKLLLEQGANPNIKTVEGYAPMYFAVRYKAYNTIELLLHHDADPQQQDEQGDTPLLQLGIKADSGGSPYISRTEECRNQGFNENELDGIYRITRALFPSQVK